MYARLPAKFWRSILIGTYLRPQRVPGQHIKSPFMGSINSQVLCSITTGLEEIFCCFFGFAEHSAHIRLAILPTILIFSVRANEFEISADYEL